MREAKTNVYKSTGSEPRTKTIRVRHEMYHTKQFECCLFLYTVNKPLIYHSFICRSVLEPSFCHHLSVSYLTQKHDGRVFFVFLFFSPGVRFTLTPIPFAPVILHVASLTPLLSVLYYSTTHPHTHFALR